MPAGPRSGTWWPVSASQATRSALSATAAWSEAMAMRMPPALGLARGNRHPLSRLFALPLMAAMDGADHEIVALQPAAAALLADLAVHRIGAPGGGACIVGPVADREFAPVRADPVDAEKS